MIITYTCFNQAGMVIKLLGLFVSVTPVEEPTDYFTHVTPDIRFGSEKVSCKSDK